MKRFTPEIHEDQAGSKSILVSIDLLIELRDMLPGTPQAAAIEHYLDRSGSGALVSDNSRQLKYEITDVYLENDRYNPRLGCSVPGAWVAIVNDTVQAIARPEEVTCAADAWALARKRFGV